jgi:hypothetical protein
MLPVFGRPLKAKRDTQSSEHGLVAGLSLFRDDRVHGWHIRRRNGRRNLASFQCVLDRRLQVYAIEPIIWTAGHWWP